MLIAHCMNPNFQLWNKYKVAVIKYCSSLESARKSVADENYFTTDKEQLGRGKRQHVPYQPYTSDDELEYNSSRECENAIQIKKKRIQMHFLLSHHHVPTILNYLRTVYKTIEIKEIEAKLHLQNLVRNE